VTPQGAGRVRHIHPLKETVTVMLESKALVEFAVTELIASKTSSGGGCSTCGGCTVKRRAGAEEDNARARQPADREASTHQQATAHRQSVELDSEGAEAEAQGNPADAPAEAPRRHRRRRRTNKS
jgi:hypothetical protein